MEIDLLIGSNFCWSFVPSIIVKSGKLRDFVAIEDGHWVVVLLWMVIHRKLIFVCSKTSEVQVSGGEWWARVSNGTVLGVEEFRNKYKRAIILRETSKYYLPQWM